MRIFHTFVGVAASLLLKGTCLAAVVSFQLDPAQSQLTITHLTFSSIEFPIPGSALGAIDLMGQGPGALDATYSGEIVADVDLSGGTVQFVGGSNIVADSLQDWYPIVVSPGVGFTGPANYGVTAITGGSQIDHHSLYDFVLDATSPTRILAGTGPYSFEASTLFSIIDGTIGHFTSLDGTIEAFDAKSNSGASEIGTATLTPIGGHQYGLTLPVNVRLPLFSQLIFGSPTLIQARFVGQLTGTATVPELGSGLLALAGAVVTAIFVGARIQCRHS